MGPQTEADRESSHPCAPDLAGSLLEAGRGSRKCLPGEVCRVQSDMEGYQLPRRGAATLTPRIPA